MNLDDDVLPVLVNGSDPGEWITMTGEYARTPIGQPYVGDLDAGPLRIGGLTLEAFGPPASDCDGSGPSGQLHLELSGPRPVEGSVSTTSGVSTGYATTVAVLDALTCERVEPDDVTFRVAMADAAVAVVDVEDLTFDPERPAGELGISISFTGPGQTVLRVEAIDRLTGDVMATVEIPVMVSDQS